jgi:phosphate:Na+ symporter
MAAIGASSTAKRLGLAYILFKLIAALIALVLFPVTIPLLMRASHAVDGVTLLAGYHTAYNVVGVVVLLPMIDAFTRFVERILPERGSPLTRCLDPAALVTSIATVEAVRRTVARALEAMCGPLATTFAASTPGASDRREKAVVPVAEAIDALRRAQEFLSETSGPPESEDEQQRLTSTVHALDHASRLSETVEQAEFGITGGGAEDRRAAEVCALAMRSAAALAAEVAALPASSDRAVPIAPGTEKKRFDGEEGLAAGRSSTEQALAELERCAKELGALRTGHRSATLSSVANGGLAADEAITRVEAVRRLEALAHHAWRSAAHLVGRGA